MSCRCWPRCPASGMQPLTPATAGKMSAPPASRSAATRRRSLPCGVPHLEADPPPLLPRQIMAGRPQPDTAQPHHGRHQPLPLPGRSHPGPLASLHINPPRRPTWDLRRARCGESRPAGAGSGPRKRTGGEGSRAGAAADPGAPFGAASASAAFRAGRLWVGAGSRDTAIPDRVIVEGVRPLRMIGLGRSCPPDPWEALRARAATPGIQPVDGFVLRSWSPILVSVRVVNRAERRSLEATGSPASVVRRDHHQRSGGSSTAGDAQFTGWAQSCFGHPPLHARRDTRAFGPVRGSP